jgi:hypothetical protein
VHLRQAAALGPDPDVAGLLRQDREHDLAGQLLRKAVRRHHAVLQAAHAPAAGPDPEGAVGGHRQRLDGPAAQPAQVLFVEDREAQPVEADQALFGGHPQVAVRGLHHVLDAELGQAFLEPPGVADVLGERPSGIERGRRSGQKPQGEGHAADECPPAGHGSHRVTPEQPRSCHRRR